MITHIEALQRNRAWVAETLQRDPDFFEELAKEHKPRFLWIGCSDARVPANVITQTPSGEMFVHRNIANQVVPTCANLLAVLEYAVDALGVRDIIVCGHSGCGGVKAALETGDADTHLPYGHVDQWIANIRTVMRLHADELDALRGEPERRYERLVELNVAEQVHNLARTSVVREAWKRGAGLRLHGWVYTLREGVLRDLGVTAAGPIAHDAHASSASPASPASDSGRIDRHQQRTPAAGGGRIRRRPGGGVGVAAPPAAAAAPPDARRA